MGDAIGLIETFCGRRENAPADSNERSLSDLAPVKHYHVPHGHVLVDCEGNTIICTGVGGKKEEEDGGVVRIRKPKRQLCKNQWVIVENVWRGEE